MAARPTDFVVTVYPTKQAAVDAIDQTTAYRIVGSQLTASRIVSVASTKVITLTSPSPAPDEIFDVGDSITIGPSSLTDPLDGTHTVAAVSATTITVSTTVPDADHTLAVTIDNASKKRSHVANINQDNDTYSDENGITQSSHYFTHKRYYYRVDSLTPSTEFYIDWDDGEDNTPQNANYSVQKFTYPTNTAIFEHTYTKHGQFFPLIRLTNAHGFKSKFYTNCEAPRSSYRELENFFDLTHIGQSASAPAQDKSIVSLDSAIYSRIPNFVPANYPPTAILKTDRNAVFSGIDNSISSDSGIDIADRRAFCYIDGIDLGIRHASGISGGVYTIDNCLEVTYVNGNDEIIKETVSATTATGTTAASLVNAMFPAAGAGYGLKEVLSVKLVNLTENQYGDAGTGGKINAKITGLYPDERIWIRLFDDSDRTGTDNDSLQAFNSADAHTANKIYPSFCYVSNGNPYVSTNEPKYYVSADGSESIPRNSNVDIYKYYLYDDKLRKRKKDGTYSAGVTDLIAEATASIQVSDLFGGTGATQVESTDHSKQTLSYTHDWQMGHQTDDTEFYAKGSDSNQLTGVGRFFDEFRLLRLQVEDGSIDSTDSTVVTLTQDGDTMDRSFIEHFGNYSYNIPGRPPELKSIGSLFYKNGTNIWRDLNQENNLTSHLIMGGNSDRGGNDVQLTLSDTATGDTMAGIAKNFLLCVRDRKFTKIFLRQFNKMTPRTLHGGSAPQCRIQAYYSHSSGWKPMPIRDNTTLDDHVITDIGQATSLFRSGTIEWDIPDDWESHVSGGINGGSWNITGRSNTANISHVGGYTVTGSAGSQVITLSGPPEAPNTIFLPGDVITLSGMDNGANNINITVHDDGCTATTIKTSTTLTNETGTGCTISAAGTANDRGTPGSTWTSTKWPQTHGEEGGYAILFTIKSANASIIESMMTHICDNQHSRVIKIVDPKHISLNAAMVAQSVGFTRQGKYYQVTDRLGRADIRRIGAQSGNITFGGVDLGDNTAGTGSRTRERLVDYQKKGTPVYYDVRHKNGTYTRFFGVIASLSEDMPTGNAPPKFAINMTVSHIVEFASDGTWDDELISLGGKVGGASSYLLH